MRGIVFAVPLWVAAGCAGEPAAEVASSAAELIFPTVWNEVPQAPGFVGDVSGDGHNNGRDIIGDDNNAAIFMAVSGAELFIRIRVNEDPRQSPTSLRQFGWGLIFDTDGDFSDYEYAIQINTQGGTDHIEYADNSVQGTLGDPSDPPDAPPLYEVVVDMVADPDHNVEVLVADTCFHDSGANSDSSCATNPGNEDYFIQWGLPWSVLDLDPADGNGEGLSLSTPLRVLGATSSNGSSLDSDISSCDPNVETCDIANAVSDLIYLDGRPADADGDGVSGGADLDDDNDGIPDSAENDAGLDPDGDNDGDGIPNYRDADDQGDGSASACTDTGLDGLCDDISTLFDTDGDGVPDHLDLDSDNDGIADIDEAGHGAADADGDGMVDGSVGINGLADVVETVADSGVTNYTVFDTDSDGTEDVRDLDSDGDGDDDVDESGNSGLDTDDDGLVDSTTDDDRDGLVDTVDLDEGRRGYPGTDPAAVDVDSDGIPDAYDVDDAGPGAGDSDGDGDDDDVECTSWPCDDDGDGVPNHMDTGVSPGPDLDGDGIADDVDLDDDNDGIPDVSEGSGDTDGDGVPDARDLDSDGDGILDVVEAGHDGADANGDGLVDCAAGYDASDNGLCDDLETSPESGLTDYDSDGGGPDEPADTDGDGLDDFQDIDSDGDGLVDLMESDSACTDTTPVDGRCDGADSDGDGIVDVLDDLDGFGDAGMSAPTDTDGDGTPDHRDSDSDDDGIDDVTEGGSGCADNAPPDGECDGPDANGDGLDDGVTPGAAADSDGDGVADVLDLDSDNDGILDGFEGEVDSDGDGVPDYLDLDSDNDGILDVVEGASGCADADPRDGVCDGPFDGDGVASDASGMTPPDTDGDGADDFRDLDSDNDGLQDAVEGGSGCTDSNPANAVCDGPVDADGIPGGVSAGDAPDSDGDGVPDYLDLDADNDGRLDIDEIGSGCTDADQDAVCDGPDTDGDGIVDSIDGDSVFGDSDPTVPTDTDVDTTPDVLDLDSDDDGTPDVDGSDCTDAAPADDRCDGDDSDGDGVVDDLDDLDGFGVGGADLDGDGIPDSTDLDDDGDGISDVDEGDGAVDTDGDGVPDSRDLDADNDGLPDAVEGNVDTDGDDIPDFRDLDSDNDTIPDAVEGNVDTDRDDTPDFRDLDSDNDTIPDAVEAGDDPTDPVDTDGDGDPDFQDTDSDDDGLDDSDEVGDDPDNPVDTDGDGAADFRDPDSDDDGVNDGTDNCRLIENGGQANQDGDELGDACDSDANGDGFDDDLGVQGGGCQSAGAAPAGAAGTGPLVPLLVLLALIAVRRRRSAGLAAALVAMVAAAGPASAQPTVGAEFSVERFRLSSDRQGLLGVEWAAVPEHLSFDVGLWLGYANDPLNIYRVESGERTRVGSLVANRFGGNLVGSVGLFDRLQVGLSVPLIISQDNDLGDVMPAAGSLQSFGLGDVRIMPKVALLDQARFGINLGLMAGVTLPTSSNDDFSGESGAVFSPELLLGRFFGSGLRVGANLGYRIREQETTLDLEVDDEIYGHAGVGYRFDARGGPPLEIDATYAVATGADDFLGAFNRNYSEIVLGASYDVTRPVVVFAATGFGTSEGFGTPDWRALAGVRVRGTAPEVIRQPRFRVAVNTGDKDSDGDGLSDCVDRCPMEPETLNGIDDSDGCPDQLPDRDGDGLSDRVDECPEQAEDIDAFDDRDGCPDPDNDRDGIADVDDRCRNEPGVVEMKGCPDPDRDGDTVVDRLDNCPDEPGPPENQGCKAEQKVKITATGLEVLDVVYFRTNRAKIRSRSFDLLRQVAAVVGAHPEIEKIRVEGHTDDRGSDDKNMKLSQARADAVVEFLVKEGVPTERLVAIGFGETQPIADNKTSEGRAKNRRVEFVTAGAADTSIETQRTGPTEDTIDE